MPGGAFRFVPMFDCVRGWSVYTMVGLLVACAGSEQGLGKRDGAEGPGAEDPGSVDPGGALTPLERGVWSAPAPDIAPIVPPAAFPYVEGSIHDFELTLSDEARASLAVDPRLDVPATFTYAGESWEVGVHLKGSWSMRSLDGKAAFKVDFRQFSPEAPKFHGLRHLTLNNMIQDRSMLREHAAYWLYEQAGVPAPRHGYARVSVNGERYGLYGLVESMDQDFLTRQWPVDRDGNLYETINASGDIRRGRADNFELKEEGLGVPFEDLQALIDTIEATSPHDFLDVLGERFDLDALMNLMALDIVMGHRDGYVQAANNFLLYYAPIADRWYMVPWGQDQTFRDDSDVRFGFDGALATRCLAAPDCAELLDDHIRAMADLWDEADLAGHVGAAVAAIGEDCDDDPRAELRCRSEGLDAFIATRPDSVRAQLR